MSLEKVVCAALVIALFFSPCGNLLGQDAGLKTEKVKPGDLKGYLKDSRGRPFSDVKLTVVDEGGNVVKEAVTNANGEYLIKGLPEGTYTLQISGQPAFNLEVTPAAGTTAIQARLPAAARDAATGGVVAGSLTTLEWTLIIVGAAAVAVGVPVLIHNSQDDDDDKKPISP